jgi:hypothetical protein
MPIVSGTGPDIDHNVNAYNARQMGANWLKHIRKDAFVYQKTYVRQVVENFLASEGVKFKTDKSMQRAISQVTGKIVRRIVALQGHEVKGYEFVDDSVEDDIPDDVDDALEV